MVARVVVVSLCRCVFGDVRYQAEKAQLHRGANGSGQVVTGQRRPKLTVCASIDGRLTTPVAQKSSASTLPIANWMLVHASGKGNTFRICFA